MKNTKEVVGLPFLCIKEGLQKGTVSELIIDPASKAVMFMMVDTGKSCFGYEVVALSDVEGVGSSLVTCRSTELLSPLFENADAMALAYTASDFIGSRVVSLAGEIIGDIVEFAFDEKSGGITSLDLSDGASLDGSALVTLTSGNVFVDNAGENK